MLCIQSRWSVTVLYIQFLLEYLSKWEVSVHFMPVNTIRSMLVAPKDKLTKEEKCGAVYYISCSNCSETCVGDSGRALKLRFPEHKWDSSPLVHHMWTPYMELNKVDGVQILDQAVNWHRWGIKEAIHIRMIGSKINKDNGHY